eukprot:CAMPEP_0113829726 /NCGR_PEP_ID=MMETSP0328-20130328/5952_1 /TAXON_ID=39455 /ORGANISM="Alexandrium minutum" /LENGTH=439 /DNA_ID=CAMNT_0000797797 /DNA_START=160 /DNA_END=1477 /DNA_ORIENTATION=- /assembly_acc=CAM_ASM_000350
MWFWTSKLLGVVPSVRGFAISVLVPTMIACVMFPLAAAFIYPTPLGTIVLGLPLFLVEYFCIFCSLDVQWRDHTNRIVYAEVLRFWTMWFCLLGGLAFVAHVSGQLARAGYPGVLVVGIVGLKMGMDKMMKRLLNRVRRSKEMTDDCTATAQSGEDRDRCLVGSEQSGVSRPDFGSAFYMWTMYTIVIYQNFILPVNVGWLSLLCSILCCSILEFKDTYEIMNSALDFIYRDVYSRVSHRLLIVERPAPNENRTSIQRLWSMAAPGELTPTTRLIETFMLKELCEILTPLHFAGVFTFDVFLSRIRHEMYSMEDVEREKAFRTLAILLVNFLWQAISCFWHVRRMLQSDAMSDASKAHLREFWRVVLSVRQSAWGVPLVLLMGSVTTLAGACMIMKSDGMDLTFKFEWLGTAAACLHVDVGRIRMVWFAILSAEALICV